MKLLLLLLLCSGSALAMEKDEEEKLLKEADREEDAKPAKPTSPFEKAYLKASKLAAQSGHPSLARGCAKMGNSHSSTLAVHQSTLTDDLAKKEKLLTHAALLNPKEPSEAKKFAAQKKYDQSLNEAHAFFKTAGMCLNADNQNEYTRNLQLYEQKLIEVDRFFSELTKVKAQLSGNKIDKEELLHKTQLNNLEIRYIWAFEVIEDLIKAIQPNYTLIAKYQQEAFESFSKCHALKYPDLSPEALTLQIQKDFRKLERDIFDLHEEDSNY